jgi:hypothetical protein
MTTNLDIIKRAMKKLHVLASGTNPTSAQAADGMDALQSLYVELIGQGSLGRLNDVLATSDYTAKEFDRIQASTGITVTLPLIITPPMCSPGGNLPYDYGFRAWDTTLAGAANRPPRDRAPVLVIQDNVETAHVYRSQTNEWVTINDLAQTDLFPFADTLKDGFAALLAERIADDYSTVAGPSTQQAARTCRWMLSAKPDSSSAPAPSYYF